MSSWGEKQEEEEEDGVDGLEEEFRSQEDHVLFLIDARHDMFLKNDKGEVDLNLICIIITAICDS